MISAMANHKNEEPVPPLQPPAPPCISIDDVVEIKSNLREIKTALMGNEPLGHKGLFTRVSNIERLIIVFGALIILLGGDRMIKLLL